MRWTTAVLALACGGGLVALAVLLARQVKAAFWLAVAMVAVAAGLTIADQFGVADVVVLLVTVAPLALLIKDRAWYLRPEQCRLGVHWVQGHPLGANAAACMVRD